MKITTKLSVDHDQTFVNGPLSTDRSTRQENHQETAAPLLDRITAWIQKKRRTLFFRNDGVNNNTRIVDIEKNKRVEKHIQTKLQDGFLI